MKKPILVFAVAAICGGGIAYGQEAQDDLNAYKQYFGEVAVAAEESSGLWDADLYGPFILINPYTRDVYANMPDREGVLKGTDGIYVGKYPEDMLFGNTNIEWAGVDRDMIMVPLPSYKYDGISLMIHERFHVVQPELGFIAENVGNARLNEREGRIYLRLELNALPAAVGTGSEKESKDHTANALTFREYRTRRRLGA